MCAFNLLWGCAGEMDPSCDCENTCQCHECREEREIDEAEQAADGCVNAVYAAMHVIKNCKTTNRNTENRNPRRPENTQVVAQQNRENTFEVYYERRPRHIHNHARPDCPHTATCPRKTAMQHIRSYLLWLLIKATK